MKDSEATVLVLVLGQPSSYTYVAFIFITLMVDRAQTYLTPVVYMAILVIVLPMPMHNTVEPPNKGHLIGTGYLVLHEEVVLSQGLKMNYC